MCARLDPLWYHLLISSLFLDIKISLADVIGIPLFIDNIIFMKLYVKPHLSITTRLATADSLNSKKYVCYSSMVKYRLRQMLAQASSWRLADCNPYSEFLFGITISR